jgi:hypothetical protein
MTKERVNCFDAGCDKCSEAIYEGKNIFGDKMYTCPTLKHKHKRVNARDCSSFRCNNANKGILCKYCRNGK